MSFRPFVYAYVIPVLIMVLLSACQSLQQAPLESERSWKERMLYLQAREHWHLRGKVGFSFVYQDKTKLLSANIDWQKTGSRFVMELSGPLGMGAFSIEKVPGDTILTNHKGKTFRASSPERLFYRHAGVRIPWSDLEWWVLGVPAPGKAFKKTFMEDTDRLAELEQSGWVVRYLSYEKYDNVVLPRKIKFSRGDIKATVIIREMDIKRL